MSKAFLVKPGFEARNGNVRYGPGVRLFVEEDEQIDVYLVRLGRPCKPRRYTYGQLATSAVPPGLLSCDARCADAAHAWSGLAVARDGGQAASRRYLPTPPARS